MGKEKRLALQHEVLLLLRKGAIEPVFTPIFLDGAQIDLFDFRKSDHLPVYFSLDKKDRRAAGINALVQHWNLYAFPHQLISLVLVMIKEIKGVLMLR